MNTLDFYNKHSDSYFEATVMADMSRVYARFDSLLPSPCRLLDLGCGSGRDSKHFTEMGCEVSPVDGSAEMCIKAEQFLGIPVRCLLFRELNYTAEFDAVWASASLLHIPQAELTSIMRKIADALKPSGLFYASFKYGSGERESSGRFYSDYSEEDIPAMTEGIPELLLQEFWLSADVLPEKRSERWLNVIWRKS
ncbi:MAG: class I SAM-dependent methyltransferase [Oscillospiraceae bacterium]|nr:class I SAM-dependent methyltransferase [Oscillospiraceae bacterium]